MHPAPPDDPRVAVFCSSLLPEVFHGVAHATDVWRPDPLDVPEIHADARRVFDHLASQIHGDETSVGRILLLQGQPGAGKTHLMRAFRTSVHRGGTACFGYMQMTSSARQYDRYVLQKLVESLEQPHDASVGPTSTLKALSDALAARLPPDRVAALQESPDMAPEQVRALADDLVDGLPSANGIDLDVCRCLLWLQVDRPSVTRRAVKFLRNEPMSDHDLQVLGGMSARHPDDAAIQMILALKVLIRRVMGRALVLCVDQLEDIYNLDASRERFAAAMDVLKTLAEEPGTLVVVSCLEEFYAHLKVDLSRSVLERIEQDPPPTVLRGERTVDEVRRLVALRLGHLYAVAGVTPDPRAPLFPFTEAQIEEFALQTTRQVLDECQVVRDAAVALQAMPEAAEVAGLAPEGDGSPLEVVRGLQQTWNDFKSGVHLVPDGDDLQGLLQRAIEGCGAELGVGVGFRVDRGPDGMWIHAEGFDEDPGASYVALCEADPRSDVLDAQVRQAVAAAGDAPLTLVRSTPFPRDQSTVAVRVAEVRAHGGRVVAIADSDWRHLVALEAFREAHPRSSFDAFLRCEQPRIRLPSLKTLLDLDHLRLPAGDAPPKPPDTEEAG